MPTPDVNLPLLDQYRVLDRLNEVEADHVKIIQQLKDQNKHLHELTQLLLRTVTRLEHFGYTPPICGFSTQIKKCLENRRCLKDKDGDSCG
jgi:hypothetical protein